MSNQLGTGVNIVNCPFCQPEDTIIEHQLAFAIYDKYPVNKGHILVITRRHVEDFFCASQEERLAMMELVEECWEFLRQEYSPDGYNLGVNCGKAAGQTIMHLHLHLIPRYRGDMVAPEGGVRGVIPAKRKY